MSILVVDIGTSSTRASVIRPDSSIACEFRQATLPDSPMAGLVEFDAGALAKAALAVARQAIAEAGPVAAVGIANQRASTIVWDERTGDPIGPGLGWQDLRTVGDCLALQADGLRLAPNQSATKIAHLMAAAGSDEGAEAADLRFGTVDCWIAWHLTEGAAHITDATNAALTGLRHLDGSGWDTDIADRLGIPASMLPTVVDSTLNGPVASALDGAPPICGMVGDQQASLVGQGCVAPGQAKVTLGTGGMLDVCLGEERPAFAARGPEGTFPIVAWQQDGRATWGAEAVMLSAGTNVEWLAEDLGLIDGVADSHAVASACDDSAGVTFVPALLGLGTPYWDHGARGTLLGVTRGTERPHVVRAVLEGVAQRTADLVEAAEGDGALSIDELRLDGGMTENPTVVQAVADAVQRPVLVAPVREATTIGAAYLAGLAVATWGGWDEIAAAYAPGARVEPAGEFDRDRWREACSRAGAWEPDLSALDF